ncbi:hypothetical protein G6F59_014702 [Rhizopus arrhizus]|nr:hypothetical protein G6F59_014702 [Rhizopus arrhizus]
MVWMPPLRDTPRTEHEGKQAQRQVDQEDARPAGSLHQHAAQQRAEYQGQRTECRPAPDRARTLARIGERMAEDRHGAGNQQRTGDALHHAPGHQRLQVAGAGAQQRPQGEGGHAEQPHPPMPITIAERAR